MKLKRGCGCLILALALVNLVFLVSALVSAAGGSTRWTYAALIILVMGGNLAVCMIVGLDTIRRVPAGTAAHRADLGDSGDLQGSDGETEDYGTDD